MSDPVSQIQHYRKKVREALAKLRRLNYHVQSSEFELGLAFLAPEKKKKFDDAMRFGQFENALHVILNEDDNDPATWNIKRLRVTARRMKIPYYTRMAKHELCSAVLQFMEQEKQREKDSATTVQQNNSVLNTGSNPAVSIVG